MYLLVLLLSLCTTPDLFIGKELLGRVTDRSVTVNLYAKTGMDVYLEYGTMPGAYPHGTALHQGSAGRPLEIKLEKLRPDTRYHYRLVYRRTGAVKYQFGPDRSFHTQRPKNSRFVFAVQAAEHISNESAANRDL